MKRAFLILVLLAANGSANAAQGQSRWCAEYGRDGRENCHFTSFSQCQAFVQGLSGWCRPSQYSYRRGQGAFGAPYR
jgi:hypothetical protein